MFRAGVLRRLKAFHQQRSASTSNARIPKLSSPQPTVVQKNIRFVLFVINIGLFGHFVANHIGYVARTAGPSMLPTISTADDWVLILKAQQRGKGLKVGDLVDFEHPLVPGIGAIKRIAAMPGDFVVWDAPSEDGEIEIRKDGVVGRGRGGGVDIWADGREEMMVQIPEGHFWALGDNQSESRDSRLYGPLPLGVIKGKVAAKVWPITEAQWFKNNVERVPYDL